MDETERFAREHLTLRFPGENRIAYEPDGNIPPDLLIDGRIAVEVRRLNEHERDQSSPRGLEEGEIPLFLRLQRLLRSLGDSTDTTRWLSLHFRRPLPDWSLVESGTRRFVAQIQDGQLRAGRAEEVAPNVELELRTATANLGDAFHLASTFDHDSGGVDLVELERNLRLCIDEKTEKVRAHRHKYPEWWLLMVDRVAFGLSEYDQAKFREVFDIPHEWDKVVLVSALDHSHYFDL